MPNGQNVTVFDGILLAFQSQQSFLLERLHRTVFHEVIIVADFGADEVIREIRVNHSRGILRIRPSSDRPGAPFLFADGKE